MSARSGRIVRRRLEFERDFTIMPNKWVRDKEMSYQARGILCLLLSHESGYSITVVELIASTPNGRESVQNAVHELERKGYLTRSQRRESNGHLSHVDWELHDPDEQEKTLQEPLDGIPAAGEPSDGILTTESRPLKKTNSRKPELKQFQGQPQTARENFGLCGHEKVDDRHCGFGCPVSLVIGTEREAA